MTLAPFFVKQGSSDSGLARRPGQICLQILGPVEVYIEHVQFLVERSEIAREFLCKSRLRANADDSDTRAGTHKGDSQRGADMIQALR